MTQQGTRSGSPPEGAAPHAAQIATLRVQVERAERATFHLASIDAALAGLDVLRDRQRGDHPLPGAAVLAELQPQGADDGSIGQRQERLLALRRGVAPDAEQLTELVTQMHMLQGEQRAELEREEHRALREEVEALGQRCREAATQAEPLHQRVRVLEQVLDTLPELTRAAPAHAGPGWWMRVQREMRHVLAAVDIPLAELPSDADVPSRLAEATGQALSEARAAAEEAREHLDELTTQLRARIG
ncbi:MAG: hypothetical protein KTR31_12250 [Myxococcales bacterium]|nr:hypothetical protein [Myxococcales bacterium]